MTTTEKWGVIYCPKEGSYTTHRRWKKIRQCLDESGVDYDLVQSEEGGSVERLATMYTQNGYKIIIVVGGDVALNEAVNGIFSVGLPQEQRPTLGVLPNGLANDFAHFWDVEEDDYKDIITHFKKYKTRKIDVALCEYKTEEQVEQRYFLNCVNLGLGASISGLIRSTRAFWGFRTLSVMMSSILLIFKRMVYKMHLKIYSENVDQKAMTLCVGSCVGYGQTPNAVPYNGMLDVTMVIHPQLTQLFQGFWLLYTGRILNSKNIKLWRAPKLSVSNLGNGQVSIDGRLIRQKVLHLDFSIEKEALYFLLP